MVKWEVNVIFAGKPFSYSPIFSILMPMVLAAAASSEVARVFFNHP